MEPEIIIHMKKLSLQDQDLQEIDAEIELNKKRYSEQFFNKNVNSINDLIVHLRRLSLEIQNDTHKNESNVINKVDEIENFHNLQTFENKDNQNDNILKDRIPRIQIPPITQIPQILGIVEDNLNNNSSHAITMGHFMHQTFESKDLHKFYAGGFVSPTTHTTSESIKSLPHSSIHSIVHSSINSSERQKSQTKIKAHYQHNKSKDGESKSMLLSKSNNKRNKKNSFDNFTPRTWDSWTSSTLSSISSSQHFSKNQINNHIPWKELINKEIPSVDNVTSLYRFYEVFEPRHGSRHGTQRKFRPEAIKNVQWPSDNSFTCLLCEKPGHFCHECRFYDCNTIHCDHLSPKTILDVIRDIDYSIKNSNNILDEKINTSLTSMDDTSKLLSKTNENFDKKNPPLHRYFPPGNPLLPIYNEVEFKNSKDYEMQAHVYRIKQVGHNHKFGLACKKLFKTKKKKYSNCLLCGHFGHPTNKCPIGPYCRYISKLNSRSCRYNIHQAVQVSFRTKKVEAPLISSVIANPKYQQSLCYRATTKMYCVENFEVTKKLDMKKINVHNSMYKVSEAEYDNFFLSKNKNDSPIMNLLKCGESISVIIGKVNRRETTMLIDTGSTITSITEDLVELLNLQTWYTNHILTITLANTQIEEYSERLCLVILEIGDVECCEILTVLPRQLYDITLGKNWLRAHMAICDHGLDILRIPNSQPIKMGLIPPIFESNMS